MRTHLCSSDHSSTSPHRRHRVCGCSVPCKQMNTQILCPFSTKPIMTHSPLFSQMEKVLRSTCGQCKVGRIFILASYAKCCLPDVWTRNAQNTATHIHETKQTGPQYCGLPPEPLSIKSLWYHIIWQKSIQVFIKQSGLLRMCLWYYDMVCM